MSDYQKKLMDNRSSDNDGEWIYSYADMMTLILGFFIILYSFSKFDEKKFDQITKEISESFKGKTKLKTSETEVGFDAQTKKIVSIHRMVSILNLESVEELHEKLEESYNNEALKKQVQEKVNSDIISEKKIEKTKEKNSLLRIILPNNFLFSSGKQDLKKESQKPLGELARRLSKLGDSISIEIVGHTDSTPLKRNHPLKNNFTLSSARAGAIAEELLKNGISKKLIRVRGMANLDPLVPEIDSNGISQPQNRQKNRRVSIIIRKRI